MVQQVENNYRSVTEVREGIFAVQLSDGGWSVADGPGIGETAPDAHEVAGYHLPVRFQSQAATAAAIISAPDVLFDLEESGEWVQHCIRNGAVSCPEYRLA